MDASSPPRVWITPEAMGALLKAQGGAEREEPCGVLLGRVDGTAVRVLEAPQTANSHALLERAFRIAPQEILEVARRGRARNLTVVGFWHGHLEAPPTPGPSSSSDEAPAARPWCGRTCAAGAEPRRSRSGREGRARVGPCYPSRVF